MSILVCSLATVKSVTILPTSCTLLPGVGGIEKPAPLTCPAGNGSCQRYTQCATWLAKVGDLFKCQNSYMATSEDLDALQSVVWKGGAQMNIPWKWLSFSLVYALKPISLFLFLNNILDVFHSFPVTLEFLKYPLWDECQSSTSHNQKLLVCLQCSSFFRLFLTGQRERVHVVCSCTILILLFLLRVVGRCKGRADWGAGGGNMKSSLYCPNVGFLLWALWLALSTPSHLDSHTGPFPSSWSLSTHPRLPSSCALGNTVGQADIQPVWVCTGYFTVCWNLSLLGAAVLLVVSTFNIIPTSSLPSSGDDSSQHVVLVGNVLSRWLKASYLLWDTLSLWEPYRPPIAAAGPGFPTDFFWE